MERGTVNIKLETLYKLANALNCEFTDIMLQDLNIKSILIKLISLYDQNKFYGK